ncbi:MAG: hypothetical protein GVY33_16015 [Alphaproteobacteria bacterium]|jgi:hypothetical protein|nr:hypothetical protein [Alphaproteobacteria bacterium]
MKRAVVGLTILTLTACQAVENAGQGLKSAVGGDSTANTDERLGDQYAGTCPSEVARGVGIFIEPNVFAYVLGNDAQGAVSGPATQQQKQLGAMITQAAVQSGCFGSVVQTQNATRVPSGAEFLVEVVLLSDQVGARGAAGLGGASFGGGAFGGGGFREEETRLAMTAFRPSGSDRMVLAAVDAKASEFDIGGALATVGSFFGVGGAILGAVVGGATGTDPAERMAVAMQDLFVQLAEQV